MSSANLIEFGIYRHSSIDHVSGKRQIDVYTHHESGIGKLRDLSIDARHEEPSLSLSQPTLSICLPTGDQLESLKRRIAYHLHTFSLANISYEIVIIDDASCDKTSAYLASLRGLGNVLICAYEQTTGFTSETEAALRSARGAFVTFLGLGDQLDAQKVAGLLHRMIEAPELAMIQAPWVVQAPIPQHRGGAPKVKQEHLFQKGRFRDFCDFVLQGNLFPGSMIVRRVSLHANSERISSPVRWPFLLTSIALQQGDVAITPTPFASVHAAFRLPTDASVLRRYWEDLFDHDAYASGLEYLVALSDIYSPPPPQSRPARRLAVDRLISDHRKVVLGRLVDAKLWMEAYILMHRIAAHEPSAISPNFLKKIASLAGLSGMASDLHAIANDARVADIAPAVLTLSNPASPLASEDKRDARSRKSWEKQDEDALLRNGSSRTKH